jgi:hypothetical protein
MFPLRMSGTVTASCLTALVALFIVAACAVPARGGTVYFEVAERPRQVVHHDSYVLGLTDAAAVSHARDLIARGPDAAGQSIVFAKIAPGGDGINRDLLAPKQPLLSWHVTEFQGFNDFGIEILDGWPTYVEQNRDTWLRETNGRIGFWNYTVTRELPGYPDVIPSVAVPLPPALPAAAVTLAALPIAMCVRRRVAR